MDLDALNRILDDMQAAAVSDPGLMPGLITAQTNDWIADLYAGAVKPKTLVDGIRFREIKVAVATTFETGVLTRAEAGERGEPYRDIAPRP